MKNSIESLRDKLSKILHFNNLSMRSKLIAVFLIVSIVPIVVLTFTFWQQFNSTGEELKEIAVSDSSAALNSSAIENIEQITTDTAQLIADFLYGRDNDVLHMANLAPNEESYKQFLDSKVGRLVTKGEWVVSLDEKTWVQAKAQPQNYTPGVSTNTQNNDMDGFNYRNPMTFDYNTATLYDEITFVDLDGNEQIKITSDTSTKVNFPLSKEKRNISQKENTYVKAENYFEQLKQLSPGEIYVSEVIGAYVGANYIGMYTPPIVAKAAEDRGYDIPFEPEAQAYAGKENPNGKRFEGIIRWATPVTDDGGKIIGYVTLALNHDHIMEFTDHIMPTGERYTQLPSAFDGNYAFIWDYQSRNIAHPRHNSIVGYDPETGERQVPWLEASIYDAWIASGIEKWTDYVKDIPTFDNQSRDKKPAPPLTKQGLVGLDGRYLNFAPQCTGWMDLTKEGGSGSFYILWSGLYKITTAGAIPYYTGKYAPSVENDFSMRGFGFVTIGAGLEEFTQPVRATEEKLITTIKNRLTDTSYRLVSIVAIVIFFVIVIAILMSLFLTNNITKLIHGVSNFRDGSRQFRFNAIIKDEFGVLADSFDDMADSIVDSVKSPLTITDMSKSIIYMNEYGLVICKKALTEIIGKPYSENSAYPVNSVYDPILALDNGTETEIYYAEESGRYIKGVANYFLSNTGEKIGYIITTADVTEMVHAQIKLEQAVNEANSANEHKGEFLARMSHEIRTPMNAIIGVSGILQKKMDAAHNDYPQVSDFKEHISQIETSSQHLLGLLNDILDLSKIEAGKIELSEDKTEMKKLVDTVVSMIKPRCSEKNIKLEVNIDDFSGLTFLCDSLRLRQVLINLLGNAVKFTPELGTIELNIKKVQDIENKTLVTFSVKDTGIGISQESLETVFQSFEQGGSSISKQYGGTGLGLAISSRIVQLFGGNIALESELGKGSNFSFKIWLERTTSDKKRDESIAPTAEEFAGKTALLVDDVEINRMIVMYMLEELGINIVEAVDGIDAVEQFKASPENTYDIIFMDIQMPQMDGYEATNVIRALERSDAKTVPIIALTANAFKEDIAKATNSGMDSHISKPVEHDNLLEVLYKYLS